MGERILNGLAWVVAAVCIAPIVAAALAAAAGDLETWRGLVETVLPRYVLNTLLLAALVAAGTAAVGTGAAWLVTMYRFPGSRALEVLLVLPLAFLYPLVGASLIAALVLDLILRRLTSSLRRQVGA